MRQSELNKILDLHELWVKTEGKEGERADLSERTLIALDFSGRDLRYANLQKANLYKADLHKANLEEAYLVEANLYEANLYKAILQKANLEEAYLVEANLYEANLRKANLCETKLRRANLEEANLERACLWDCTGNNKEIKNIDGLRYPIAYTSKVLQIGCRNHTFERWENFTDEEIDKMDCKALEFWREYKGYIFEMIENNPAV